MTPTIDDEESNTIAALLLHLGVGADRVILNPPPGHATEADVIRLEAAPRKRLCELVDGTLVEKAMGFNESSLAAFLIEVLGPFIRRNRLGLVAGSDGMVRLYPGRVRIPDVCFVSWDRLPGRKRPKKPIPDVAPNLAVEILSRRNTRREMELKRIDYFKAGVQLVWEIELKRRFVDVYTSADDHTRLTESDTLDGGTVLPGFTLAVAELFCELDRHG